MVKSNNPKVCVFDSGIGGLNLLYECVRRLPCVDFEYFADNFRMPYGNLAKDVLMSYVEEIFGAINERKPYVVAVACNTVTASCIDYLRAKYTFPIVGIQPAVKPAVSAGGKCLVLATQTTAESTAVKNLVKQYGGDNTNVVAVPKLASLIEKNEGKADRAEVISLLPNEKPDTVVLGCTHYIYVKEIIGEYYGCPVFDGTDGTASRLCGFFGKTERSSQRAQSVTFTGGDCAKNRRIFSGIILSKGGFPK